MIAARTGDEPGQPAEDGQGLRVLVVEDHADTAVGTALLLRRDGHQVVVAADGRTALRAAQAWPPDVVLLDLSLPGMDGWEVARRLRERPAAKQPLFIALTGLGGEEDRRRSEAAGIDLHLVKPLDPQPLRRLLRRFRSLLE